MSETSRFANGRTTAAVVEREREIPRPRTDAELLAEVLAQPRTSIPDMKEMAKQVQLSGLGGFTEAQAFTVMMICEAENLHPIQAVRRFHVIKGKLAMRAEAVLAEMLRRGWSVTWATESDDAERQSARFVHAQKCPEGKTVGFSMLDARRAGVAHGDNWKSWPSAMMRSRVNTIACRMLDPGIIAGIYTDQEVEEMQSQSSPSPEQKQAVAGLRAALDAAKRGEATDLKPEPPAPSRSDCRAFIDEAAARFNAQWQALCLDAGKPPGKGVTSYQVINGMISGWLEAGEIEKDAVTTDGVRDKAKAGAVVKAAWDADADAFRDDVADYLRAKFVAMAEQAGIPLPTAPAPETAANGDDDLPDDPEWQPGRE